MADAVEAEKIRLITGVRIVHEPSGAVGECREERHQHTNKKRAWERLANSPKFRMWARHVAAELRSGKTVDEEVEEMMQPNNLKIEQRDEQGHWIEVKV